MPTNLIPHIRLSLQSKLLRLLDRPLIGCIPAARSADPDPEPEAEPTLPGEPTSDLFDAIRAAMGAKLPNRAVGRDAWIASPDGDSWTVRLDIDYDDRWRGYETYVVETVRGTIESEVTFLTDEQRRLLERSPREFLALEPRPETAPLLEYDVARVGGSDRVVAVRVAKVPASRVGLRHVAFIPNVIPLERQLDALRVLEAPSASTTLLPLRVLVGGADVSELVATPEREPSAPCLNIGSKHGLDEFQMRCLELAEATPHFAVIEGPPGSGKTKVIAALVERETARGGRVLVVSSTHVAVDNLVTRLGALPRAHEPDPMAPESLPVRYAARKCRVSDEAAKYWVGPKEQARGATVALRVERAMRTRFPFGPALFGRIDDTAQGVAPISRAVARTPTTICGTPIGILSYEPVKSAAPGSFDLLVVDEVSKLTLPEFLAVAVKAKRWVVVGDPEQLPAFNDTEDNGCSLDDLVDPELELVCSIGAFLERARPERRSELRVVVVAKRPIEVATAIRAHLHTVMPDARVPISPYETGPRTGILVCAPASLAAACQFNRPTAGTNRGENPDGHGSVDVLVQRGIAVPRPEVASGMRFVAPSARAQSRLFEIAFNVYHALPWTLRAKQRLAVVERRGALECVLPSVPAIAVLGMSRGTAASPAETRATLLEAMAARYMVNTVSLYDWLVPANVSDFDVSPLREMGTHARGELADVVRPFVSTLQRQYRMDASLSRVPRNLFYFDRAMHDGVASNSNGVQVELIHVRGPKGEPELNITEAEHITKALSRLNAAMVPQAKRPNIMVITPYRKQEALLSTEVWKLRDAKELENLDVDVCTLDRCQGREADYVFISLVCPRASIFFDMPKRWNVAVTRARRGLCIVGDLNAYRDEASRERNTARNHARNHRDTDADVPCMSVVARLVEAYDHQLAAGGAR